MSALATLGSLFFYFLSTLGLASFLSDRRKALSRPPLPASQLPPVSILKPLKGVDPEIWESFCSHCEQVYPEFQLIFGVSDPADPAVEVVRRLQAKYPALAIELIVCNRILGTNIKVSNLAQMLPAARYEFLLVNDSDVLVPSDYLRVVMTPLADDSVGLVTCLYRGVGASTLGSRLEALGISTDFVPGVLSARFLEKGLHFGLGSTLAFRRRDLEGIGGFEVLLDYLADDNELGRRIAATGKRVELSSATVTTYLPVYTMRQFFQHQLRWSRTIRASRRWGYAGLLFTFGLPWALVTLLAARGAVWAWVLLAMTFAARVAVGFVTAVVVLDDHQFFRDLVLLPLRDLIAPFVWAAGLMGRRIHWRGDVFDLKDGRLIVVK
ncbi:MAG: bacteriohopanetetrol glucosamine biosynthesis glycosyltransferase HpnI [Terriglobales bacterium]